VKVLPAPAVVGLALLACGTGSNPELAGVDHLVFRLSDALATGDSAGLSHLAAPGFVLLEDGVAYDLGSAVASSRSVLATGTLVRTVEDLHSRVRGKVAWSRYRVRGQFRGAAGVVPIDLLETVLMERGDAEWRVVLMTSMPAKGRLR
jgi:hypothetical protein